MNTVRKYGNAPFTVALLHGGPGAAGEMRPVAEALSGTAGILELLQTEKTIDGQIKEVHNQLMAFAGLPVVLVGYSWGAWLALLVAEKYPLLARKIILIGAGAFENKYNKDLTAVRLNRLSYEQRNEAEKIISAINSKSADNNILQRFGELMTIADSYAYSYDKDESAILNWDIYQSVWPEAAQLRDSDELIRRVVSVRAPIVAFHGNDDPHPVDGVEKPFLENGMDFKMIRLDKCGHTPWKEKYAKDIFYALLSNEINC